MSSAKNPVNSIFRIVVRMPLLPVFWLGLASSTATYLAFSSQKSSWAVAQNQPPKNESEQIKTLSEQVESLRNQLTIAEKAAFAKGGSTEQEYVKGLIEAEADNKAKDAVNEKVEQLKGELFGQIDLPIITAIVSIFLVFVVRDAITTSLQDGKDEKIKNSLKEELKPITESIIKKSLSTSIGERLGWLEYEIATIDNRLQSIHGDDSQDNNGGDINQFASMRLKLAISQVISRSELEDKGQFLAYLWSEQQGSESERQNNGESSNVSSCEEYEREIDDYIGCKIAVRIQRIELMLKELEENKLLDKKIIKNTRKQILNYGNKLAVLRSNQESGEEMKKRGEKDWFS
jgi:hypothetical protein